MEPGGPRGPDPGEGDERDGPASRRSSAHQRVFQRARPCCRRAAEEAGRRGGRRFVDGGRGARQEPGQYRRREGPQRTAGDQRCREGRVGPVEQPGDQEGGAGVGGRHRPGGVLPGVTAAVRRRRGTTGVRQVLRTGVPRAVVAGSGDRAQREMRRALRGQRARDDREQSGAAAREGQYGDELRDGEDGHEPPRHLPAVDRVMADGREHTADDGEGHGPDHGRHGTRHGADAPAFTPRRPVTRHGHPPSSPAPVATPGVTSHHFASRRDAYGVRSVASAYVYVGGDGPVQTGKGPPRAPLRPPRRGTSSARGRPGGTPGSTGGSAGCRASRPWGCGSAGVSRRTGRGGPWSRTGRPGGRRPCR